MTAPHVIEVRNVRTALLRGLAHLGAFGMPQETRAGRAVTAPGPVITFYEEPWQCVLASQLRDANPFFHLYEAVWMLAGRDEAGGLSTYVKDFGTRFAEDDGNIHGAYGYRWRFQFGYDQLSHIIERLREDLATRQAVLEMWDATKADNNGADDLRANVRDRPCNTHVYFRMRAGHLDMTVCCRSNDAIMGAYGANAVHFAFLQQYVAGKVGVPAGTYTQISNDFHVYEADLERLAKRADLEPFSKVSGTPQQHRWMIHLTQLLSEGATEYPRTQKLVADPVTFDADLGKLMHLVDWLHADGPHNSLTKHGFNNPFLDHTVLPALEAHAFYRAGDWDLAVMHTAGIRADDWRAACYNWLKKREKRT